MDELYNVYSQYLKNKYGEKVYKLPINLPVTCPNRDGIIGNGGCIYCSDVGAGFENLSEDLSVFEQIEHNKAYIGKRYGAKRFIAYFQNYTNTYIKLEQFKNYINQAMQDDVVEIAISTRPDCINDDYLKFLSEVSKSKNINISLEYGLQTVNYKTLKKINRGHGLAEFIDAVMLSKKYNFEVCTHLILNLPWDDKEDVIENAKIISALNIDSVKLHALYICENTVLGDMYKRGEVDIISKDEYIERVIMFLEYLNPKITIQRIIGRAPMDKSLFCNWDTSWWKIRDELEFKMRETGTFQGKRFDYLKGSVLRRKFDL